MPVEAPEPDEAERLAFDMAKMRDFADRFANWRLSENGRAAGVDYALARAMIAFHHHDFSAAISDFRAYAEAFPTRDGALVACDILCWLSQNPYDDPLWVELMTAERSGPDPASLSGRNVLVLTEAGPDEVEAALEGLTPDTSVTVSFPILFDLSRRPKEGWHFLSPPSDIWYKPEGFEIHRACERLCEEAAQIVRERIPTLAHATFAAKMALVDLMLDDYCAFYVVDRLLEEGDFDDLVVVTRHYALYRSAQALAEGRLAPDRVHAAFIGRPSLRTPPGFVYWPEPKLRDKFAMAAASRAAMLVALERKIASCECRDNVDRPAIIVWPIADRNARLALRRMVEEISLRRPIILILTAGDAEKTEHLGDEMEKIAARAGHWLLHTQYDAFLKQSSSASFATRVAADAVRAAAAARSREGEGMDRVNCALMQFDLPQTYVDQIHLRALQCLTQWIESVCDVVSPAYFVTCEARNFIIASAIETVQKLNVPALDANLTLIGNQARQVRYPMDFFATIDTGHADFASALWDFPRERILSVGYLWSALSDRKRPPDPTPDGWTRVVYATQPTPREQSLAILEAVLQVISEFANVRLVVKLHPRDMASAFEDAREAIERFGLSERADIAPMASSIEPLLDACDLVVLRNSAVGLEAAGRSKALLRCLNFDMHLAKILLDVPYAVNTFSIEDFKAQMRRLIAEPGARDEVAARQRDYVALNPCLFFGGGHEVLAAFLEKHVAGDARTILTRKKD